MLFVPWLAATLLAARERDLVRPLVAVLELAGMLWFVTGIAGAGVLFVRSYLRAASADARRRLRVALAGSVFGFGPLLGLIVLRMLSPVTEVPGERFALLLTLMVPASFAYAIAVHRIFEFRVALRSARGPALVAVAFALAFVIAERPGGRPGGSFDSAGIALATMGLLAAGAGSGRRRP